MNRNTIIAALALSLSSLVYAAAPSAQTELTVVVSASIPSVLRIEWDSTSGYTPATPGDTAVTWAIGATDLETVATSNSFVVVNKGTKKAKVTLAHPGGATTFAAPATVGWSLDNGDAVQDTDEYYMGHKVGAAASYTAFKTGSLSTLLTASFKRNEKASFGLQFTTPSDCNDTTLVGSQSVTLTVTAEAP
jgi:hypothetical protein